VNEHQYNNVKKQQAQDLLSLPGAVGINNGVQRFTVTTEHASIKNLFLM
jgi:hypothetical protein